ncbi:MAG: cbb3-type cytochrome c oxidase subunit I [Bacillota bacterium]
MSFRWDYVKSSLARIFGKNRHWSAPPPRLKTLAMAYPFCLLAILMLGSQGLLATLGALGLVFPDLPELIPYQAGRAVHLNLSILWPLLGAMGAIYFFFAREAEVELWSWKWVIGQFLVTTGTVFMILFFLSLGYTEGREYLEALRPFGFFLAAGMFMFNFILWCTFLKKGVPRVRATLVGMLTGSFTLLVFYAPNLFAYAHPTTDELVKFWVVHLWEELSLELIGASLLVAFLIHITGVKRNLADKLLYLDLLLIALAGLMSTGHHYYWIGTPRFWLWIGGIFSSLQVIPIVILAYSAYRELRLKGMESLGKTEKVTLGFILSSIVYHIFGAGALGLAMAIPQSNIYMHGTFITSAHAHLALFGVVGFLVLGLCYYIIVREVMPTPGQYRMSALALVLLNCGLAIMGMALLVAGILQAYMWRVIGMDFMQVQSIIRPYLFGRVLGGMIFAAGGVLLSWNVTTMIWSHRWKFWRLLTLR